MSVAGGTFCVSRAIRGGAHSCVIASSCIGIWPMRQSTGSDWDGETVSDRSGNGRDAGFGLLSAAEIGDNAGYATSIASGGHSVKLPYASWPQRWATDSLIVMGRLLATAGGSTLSFFGNGASASITGARFSITSGGQLQVNVHDTTGALKTSASTSSTPNWSGSSEHSWLVAYDPTDYSLTLGIGGSIRVLRDTTIPSESWVQADALPHAEISLTGRIGTGSAGIANQARALQAYYWRGGLPMSDDRLAQLFARYDANPFLPFRGEDLVG